MCFRAYSVCIWYTLVKIDGIYVKINHFTNSTEWKCCCKKDYICDEVKVEWDKTQIWMISVKLKQAYTLEDCTYLMALGNEQKKNCRCNFTERNQLSFKQIECPLEQWLHEILKIVLSAVLILLKWVGYMWIIYSQFWGIAKMRCNNIALNLQNHFFDCFQSSSFCLNGRFIIQIVDFKRRAI